MAEQFDFYNPFMAAAIVTADGVRFPLWIKTEEAARASARLGSTASLPFLQSLSVELQLAYLPIIKAVLTPPYRDAINVLDSALIEWGQSILEVQFGYIGSASGGAVLSPVYSGVLLKPDVQLGQDITVTLNAQGVGGFAAVRQEGNLTLNNVTRRDVVKTLAAPFKLEVVDDEVKKAAPFDEFVIHEWKTFKLPTYAQGGDSYWTAMLKVVREAGLHMHLVGNRLHILPPSYIFSSAPARVFRLYDFPNGRIGAVQGDIYGPNKVFPILSASSPTSAVYLPGSSRGFFVQDVNSFDREEIRKLIGDEQVAAPRTEAGDATISNDNTFPAANPETGDGAEMFPGNPSDAQLISQVRAEYSAQTAMMGVQLTLESLGDPTMLPGSVSAVRGLGARLNGNYAALKVVHTMSGSGYTMSVEGVSNVGRALENAQKAFGPTAPDPSIDEGADTGGSVVMEPRT